jgi:hypothetical protein
MFFRRMLVFSGGCGRGAARIQRFGVMVVSLCWNGDGGWIVVMVAGVILVCLQRLTVGWCEDGDVVGVLVLVFGVVGFWLSWWGVCLKVF